jgi:phosphate-selective porin OprO/OprP
MLHLGASYSNRTPQSSAVQYQSRPEARFVEFLADTGELDSSRIQLSGLEAAAVRGPLWLQAEAISSQVTTADFGKAFFWGSYVQAGFFLTGDVRPYATDHAVFGRLIPTGSYRKGSPFRRSKAGAWEVSARLSNVDLNDAGIEGGSLTDLSLGLNWYPNATSRLLVNYIRARTEEGGRANIGLLRYQYRPRAR